MWEQFEEQREARVQAVIEEMLRSVTTGELGDDVVAFVEFLQARMLGESQER